MNTNDIDFDPYCDPLNPRKIKYDDIVAASRRIIGAVLKTPCTKANLSEKLGMDVYLKQENKQYTGSFKDRGAVNCLTILNEDQKKNGVVCATMGNWGGALSYHSGQLGVPCIVVVSSNIPISYARRIESFGGKIVYFGSKFGDTRHHAMTICHDKKMMYINGYDHPNLIEGFGTVGLEIVEQVPNVDAVLVPCGGGGLLAGVAIAIKHLKPDTEGIETDKTCSMVEALRKNERVTIEIENTIANCLGLTTVGVNAFHNVKGLVDKMVVVKEDWVARAIMRLVEEDKLIAEGAGAVGVAALMAGLFPHLKGKRVVCVVSGGNVDVSILTRSMERGLAADGRLVKFKVTLSDKPGAMAELFALLSAIGTVVKDCIPERSWVKGDVFSVEMRLLCETKGWEHTKELQEQIKKHYKEFYFQDMGETSKPGRADGTRRGPCLAPNPVCMQK